MLIYVEEVHLTYQTLWYCMLTVFLNCGLYFLGEKESLFGVEGRGCSRGGRKGFPLNDEAGGAQDREICSRYVEMESC